MGARGPKPTPAALQLVRGNPGRRAINLDDGVNPPVRAPAKPKHLVGAAGTEWKRIVPLLLELGLLTELDRAALALYCHAWGEIVMLTDQLAKDRDAAIAAGQPPDTALWRTLPSGIARESIRPRLLREAEVRCDRALASFGLSPATRARVTASRDDGAQLGLPGVADPVGDKLSKLRLL